MVAQRYQAVISAYRRDDRFCLPLFSQGRALTRPTRLSKRKLSVPGTPIVPNEREKLTNLIQCGYSFLNFISYRPLLHIEDENQ